MKQTSLSEWCVCVQYSRCQSSPTDPQTTLHYTQFTLGAWWYRCTAIFRDSKTHASGKVKADAVRNCGIMECILWRENFVWIWEHEREHSMWRRKCFYINAEVFYMNAGAFYMDARATCVNASYRNAKTFHINAKAFYVNAKSFSASVKAFMWMHDHFLHACECIFPKDKGILWECESVLQHCEIILCEPNARPIYVNAFSINAREFHVNEKAFSFFRCSQWERILCEWESALQSECRSMLTSLLFLCESQIFRLMQKHYVNVRTFWVFCMNVRELCECESILYKCMDILRQCEIVRWKWEEVIWMWKHFTWKWEDLTWMEMHFM